MIWTIILAAGGSTRYGGPKALAAWKAETLLTRAITVSAPVTAECTLIVTGGYSNDITATIPASLPTVYNANWQQGLGTSIACGVSGIMQRDPDASLVVILPVDQPLVSSDHLQALINLSNTTGRPVFFPQRRCFRPSRRRSVVPV